MKRIYFNHPYTTGNEIGNVQQVVKNGKFSGNGDFTKACEQFFEQRYNFPKTLMLSSCTAALEMCALLIDFQAGDEIIMPSYTFVSCANAFALRGAKIKFVDSCYDNPNYDYEQLESLITPKTKAILVIHYAGIANEIERLQTLCKDKNIYLIEDAAHAIDAFSENKSLGSFGDLSTFSFHETKNIHCGEGGLLVINNPQFIELAEIIREKGTNRNAFNKGIVDKYTWVHLGSSYVASELNAAFLLAQLTQLTSIQERRITIWKKYYDLLKPLGISNKIQLAPEAHYDKSNGHIFYLICSNIEERDALLNHLRSFNINAVFHYQALHASNFFTETLKQERKTLVNAEKFTDCLIRLPLHLYLTDTDIEFICGKINEFFI